MREDSGPYVTETDLSALEVPNVGEIDYQRAVETAMRLAGACRTPSVDDIQASVKKSLDSLVSDYASVSVGEPKEDGTIPVTLTLRPTLIDCPVAFSTADRETIRSVEAIANASRCAKCSGPIGDARARICHECEVML